MMLASHFHVAYLKRSPHASRVTDLGSLGSRESPPGAQPREFLGGSEPGEDRPGDGPELVADVVQSVDAGDEVVGSRRRELPQGRLVQSEPGGVSRCWVEVVDQVDAVKREHAARAPARQLFGALEARETTARCTASGSAPFLLP